MNIGIVTTWFERGAAYVSKAYESALEKDNNIFIFARGGEEYAIGNPNWDKSNVTWGKRYSDSTTRINWIQFRKWVKNNKIEVVIFNEQSDWEIIIDSKKLDIKTVAYIDYYTQRTVPYFQLYDAVICHTKRHYSVFKDHNQAFYIPWGTNTALFKPRSDMPSYKKDVTFFHSAGMGGVNLRKGTDLLVRAFCRDNKKAKLIIHSQVPKNKYETIRSLIDSDSRIEFIEKTVAAPGLYYLGDVYVYPTRLEGLGLTIMEALASGLPVITTDCQPMNEFVVDRENGKLVAVENYLGRLDGYYWAESICSEESLSNAMHYYIDNKNKLEQAQKNARDFALNHLNWETNSEMLNTAIQQIKKNADTDNYLEHYKNEILGYSFSRRINGNTLYKRTLRKISRIVNAL